jgi:hypothetical protein
MTVRPASTVRTESCLLRQRLAAARFAISALTGIPRILALCYRLTKPFGSRRILPLPQKSTARLPFKSNAAEGGNKRTQTDAFQERPQVLTIGSARVILRP